MDGWLQFEREEVRCERKKIEKESADEGVGI